MTLSYDDWFRKSHGEAERYMRERYPDLGSCVHCHHEYTKDDDGRCPNGC